MTAKTIKRRTESVSNTQQIMKAMHLVATSKLQKAKSRLDAARPLFFETKRMIDNLKHRESLAEHVFFKPREVKSAAYVVITGDRGLCGAYNTNVCKEAMTAMNAGPEEKVIALGVRGWDYFRRRGKTILRGYSGVSETALYEDAVKISHMLTSLYTSGEVDSVYMAYTKFDSVISQTPCLVKLLPVYDDDVTEWIRDDLEYVPGADSFLEHAAPMYLNVRLYDAMLESAASEQAARMVSMDAAANNAEDIIEELTLEYNRIRQGAITNEISEIVNGANAQK